MSVEATLAKAFGYEYCTLFESARKAIFHSPQSIGYRIPSNVCPALESYLLRAVVVPVNPETGLSIDSSVHLYGYMSSRSRILEIDPLMTGFFKPPYGQRAIISFGRKKALDLGAGGAAFTNDKGEAWESQDIAHFPEGLREPLERKLASFYDDMMERWRRVEWWDRHLGDSCIRIPGEQVIPWRVIRRIPEHRDAVVKALRDAGFDAGTNYPPLPGVTDPGAIQWGKEVINLWVTPDYDEARIRQGAEIIKRTIDPGPQTTIIWNPYR